jgi:hypothetical protein
LNAGGVVAKLWRPVFPLILMMLSGCASVSIDDLAFTSVEVVDRRDQAELPPPGDLGRTIARMVGDPNVAKDYAGARAPGYENAETPHELLLKAKFTSQVYLSQIDYADDLSNKTFFCDRPNAHVRLAFPDVYWRGFEVPPGNGRPIRPGGRAPGPPITYYIFLRVALEEQQPGKPPFESFDLLRSPQSICFSLEGGRYRAFGYRSNTVMVPRNAIVTALHNRPIESVH